MTKCVISALGNCTLLVSFVVVLFVSPRCWSNHSFMHANGTIASIPVRCFGKKNRFSFAYTWERNAAMDWNVSM